MSGNMNPRLQMLLGSTWNTMTEEQLQKPSRILSRKQGLIKEQGIFDICVALAAEQLFFLFLVFYAIIKLTEMTNRM